MKDKFEPPSKSKLIGEVMEMCVKAADRGMSDEDIAEGLLIATVTRLFLTLWEDTTAQVLRKALRDVENGEFALLLEADGLIERRPPS